MEQLNLFNLDENDDKNEKVSPHNEIKEIVEHDVEELLMVVATSLKEDNREKLLAANQKTQFQVMDKVKIVLISEDVDSETHNYRKYYEPHLIGKIGEITKINVSSRGKMTYEVNVYGEKSIFEEAELVWIG